MPPAVPESLLPRDVLNRADVRGNEYAWPRGDLARVFAAAQAAGLASRGGQVQLRLPDGTCELYWQNFDVEGQRPGESWEGFVARSRHDVEVALSRLPPDEALLREGLEQFDFLREQAAQGVDLAAALCFVCYFSARLPA